MCKRISEGIKSQLIPPIILILLLGFFSGTVFAGQGSPRLVFVKQIWSGAKHNAFTDLCRYKGYWYCVFREGNSHKSKTGNGQIRIIRSRDTANWKTVSVIADPQYDLRDPKLTITPRGKLMMHYMVAKLDSGANPNTDLEMGSSVMFTKNGKRWTKPVKMNLDSEVAWRVTWVKDTAYTIAYNCKSGCTLYKSHNGINFTRVCRFSALTGNPNEATLQPLADGRLMAVVRRETAGRSLYIGTSSYPYTNWNFTEVATFAGGPNTLMLPDSSVYLAHRSFRFGSPRLCLSRLSDNNVEEEIIIESGGDCGYAGMCWFENALWLSYYSGDPWQQTKIYIAKVVFDLPAKIEASADTDK